MKKNKIRNLILFSGSGSTPSRKEDAYWNSRDIPWLKTEQLGEYKIFDTNEYISKTALQNTSIRLWPIHTVSIAMYGEGKTRGNASILMSEMATNQACCNIIVDEQQADYRFLYYWIKHNYIQLRTLAAGVRKNLNSDDIKRFPFPDFSQKQQQAIADVLSSFDERITLNQSICSELEAMAKTLYDYWFVQFDFPDENGKPYRTSGGAMEWCQELGREVPKGWNVGILSDIANITMGQSPAGESYNENGEGMMFFQGSTDFGSRFPMPRVYTTAPTRFAKTGDILMSVRAPVGALNIAMEDCCIGRGLAALNSKIGSQIYLIQLLNNFRAVFDSMNGNGTTFGSINKDTLHALKIIIPPNNVLQQFEMIITPIEKQIRECEKENQELSTLRDWLLPMMMNGQARIKHD